MPRKSAKTCAMRGISDGVLRPCGVPLARSSAVTYSQCGGMSGESVSSTKASKGNWVANRRNWFKRQRPAKTQLEAHGDELLRLLHTAIERVGNAALHWRLAQTLEKQISTAPHMQDDGQVELLRQFQLRFVKELLPRHVQTRHKTIEADFTQRHQARVGSVLFQSGAQGLQVGLMGLRGVHRVYA